MAYQALNATKSWLDFRDLEAEEASGKSSLKSEYGAILFGFHGGFLFAFAF